MKFRAKMTELGCMKQFYNIVAMLAKLSKTCILRICPQKIFFIISEEGGIGGKPMVWCELEQAHFFNEYTMGGFSDTHNEIYLEFPSDSLAKSLNFLKVSQGVRSVKIKLTNKKSPCLTFELELMSLVHSRLCVHDIPVIVIGRRQWSTIKEPQLPNFDVRIEMPNLKLVRNVVERMRTMSPHLIVSASNEGVFLLRIETDVTTVTTHFKNLAVETAQGGDQREPLDPSMLISARVDIKKLSLFLASEQVNPTQVMCDIKQERLLHLVLMHEDVTLHYFAPSIST
ncbi:checkpoint protein HUS1 [Anabrus simplex]|uniref:checkpoint protein HUS1 n=1 Tax=Anabrus simplex TaxID=316456 RepID=UPI0035A3B6B0